MDAMKELSSFLEEKLALLTRYCLLTEMLRESVRRKEPDAMMIPLSRRAEIVRRIEKIDSSLGAMMSARQNEDPERAAKLRGTVEIHRRKVAQVLEQIALKEADFIPLIKGEREELRAEILRMRETRNAAASYQKPKVFSPRFLDASR
jgi:hypothetical protein